MRQLQHIGMVLLIYMLTCSRCFAQEDISLKKEVRDDGKARVTAITNHSDHDLTVILKNEDDGAAKKVSVKTGQTVATDVTCTLVYIDPNTNNGRSVRLWKREATQTKNVEQKENLPTIEKPSTTKKTAQTLPAQSVGKEVQTPALSPRTNSSIGIESLILEFHRFIETIPYYSASSIEEETTQIENHINNLRNWKDKNAYIADHQLNSYIYACEDSLTQHQKNVTTLITDFLSKYSKQKIVDKSACIDSMQAILTSRLEQRQTSLNRLSREVNDTSFSDSSDSLEMNWKVISIGVGLAVLIFLLFIWFKKASQKNRRTIHQPQQMPTAAEASSAIVVRRKTTSILKKQSLEDVIDNGAYMRIDCDDFCNDSAVRRMYIKNTCIKDIYNMYAEDLRNPNNPKEDGCMVLGRWVFDKERNEYDISLEHIVLPGDDAIFDEYELNFGGKIKLKVTEKLRKLRRETNLQYDLTCWVHSHPGLGVFFSNSDSNVQMQLKHPTHPRFLTAIVVDILTPSQELGIFTFSHDQTINSKADLKKMYSLEELYQWAVESDRNSFKAEDYYNTLTKAISHTNECQGIELSNGAIIDMGILAAEQDTGSVGIVHGFSNQQGSKTEHVAVTVTKTQAVPDHEPIGCFVTATLCSIPSIRKAIARYMGISKFVLVYTKSDGLLTSIPILNQEICTDENYYGKQKLEELKIWTRRKR